LSTQRSQPATDSLGKGTSSRGGVPAYYKLYVLLAQSIRDGEIEAGAPLQSESEMTARYGVSRITVRRALELLEKESLIVRRRGARTCVAPQETNSAGPLIEGPIENLLTRGLAAAATNIEVGWKPATLEVSEALRMNAGEPSFCVIRLRTHDETPFSYSRIYVAPRAAAALSADDLTVDNLGSEPILIKIEKARMFASVADQTITACLAQAPAANALKVPVGSALIQLRRTVFDQNDEPFIYQVSLYRPDKYEYNMRMSRERANTRPQWQHI